MQTPSTTPRSATTAIAAVLALLATPVPAQEASSPPLDGPIVNVPPPESTAAVPIMPAAEPAPTLVIPDAPVAEPATEPATAPQAAAPVRAASEPRAAAPVAAAPADASDPIESEPAVASAPEEALPPVMAEQTRPASIEPGEERAADVGAILPLALVTLLGLAAAIFAFAALRRRGPATRRTAAAARVPASRPTPRPVASVAEPAPLAQPVPVLDRAPVFMLDRAPAPVLNRALPSHGAAVALPARVPETYRERDALLKRMLDAPPDRANPFTDRRARLKRARLILQSLGRKFERARPWIDLSDYPENWPALARRQPARPVPVETRQLEPA